MAEPHMASAASLPRILASTPPRGRGKRVAICGDSFIGGNSIYGETRFVGGFYTACSLMLLNVFCNQCFVFDYQLDNFAFGRATSERMIEVLPALIARRPDVAFMQGSHNDLMDHGIGVVPRLLENWQHLCDQLLLAGVTPVLILNPPLNSTQNYIVENDVTTGMRPYTFSGLSLRQLRQADAWVNQWKRQYAEDHSNVLIWDWHSALADPNDPDGGALPSLMDNMVGGGVHANWPGQHVIARRGLIDLAPIIGPASTFCARGLSDVYDPVFNPRGNLNPNAQMLGDDGIVEGGFTGRVPSFWAAKAMIKGAGKLLACTTSPRADGFGNDTTLTVGGRSVGGTTNEGVFLTNHPSPIRTDLPGGTVIEGMVEVSVAANSPWSTVYCRIGVLGGDTLGNWYGPPVYGTADQNRQEHWIAGPDTAWSGTIRTPPLVIPPIGGGLYVYYQAQYNDAEAAGGPGTFAGSVTFGAPTIRINPTAR